MNDQENMPQNEAELNQKDAASEAKNSSASKVGPEKDDQNDNPSNKNSKSMLESSQPESDFIKSNPKPQLEIGRSLQKTREELGYSTAKIALMLKVPQRHIEHIEADNYEYFRNRTFARGYLMAYLRLLNLDPDPYKEAFQVQFSQRIWPGEEPSKSIDEKEPSKLVIPKNNQTIRGIRTGSRSKIHWIQAILILLVLAGIVYAVVLVRGNFSSDDLNDVVQRIDILPETNSEEKSAENTIHSINLEQIRAGASSSTDSDAPSDAVSSLPVDLPLNPSSNVNQSAQAQQNIVATPSIPERQVIEVRTTQSQVWVGVYNESNELVENETIGTSELNDKFYFEFSLSDGAHRVSIGQYQNVVLLYNGAQVNLAPYRRGNVVNITLPQGR